MDDKLKATQEKMEKALTALESAFASVRAGRANAAVLDNIKVDYYGTPTPINQIGPVSVPEPHMLVIQPWDATALKDIEKAILASELGINPNNDGKVIRLAFPPLTEERRKELVKTIHKDAEGGKVAIRNIRRDAMDAYKAMKKGGELTEDDLKGLEKDVQNLTDKYIKKVDTMLEAKEKELMEIG